jgi:hypothetical protein
MNGAIGSIMGFLSLLKNISYVGNIRGMLDHYSISGSVVAADKECSK